MGGDARKERHKLVFGGFARGYAIGRVAQSRWRVWLGWRNSLRKGCWLGEEISEMERIDDLTASVAYCCEIRRSKEETML